MPVVLIVKFGVPEEPLTVPKVIGVPAPAPTVNVTPSDKVVAPKVICPVDVQPTVEFHETVIPVVAVNVTVAASTVLENVVPPD